MALTLSSSAFAEGEFLPAKYTCEGAGACPPLHWNDAPQDTCSFALLVHDLDAPRGDFTHWLHWNIPAEAAALPGGGTPRLGTIGTNSFGKMGYGGPCPSDGHGPHRYVFVLYALDIERLHVYEGAERAAFEAALAGHVLAQAELTAFYERKEDERQERKRGE